MQGAGGGWDGGSGFGATQTHPTDLEVFFETVGLEKIGELESADVAMSGSDFALQIDNDGAQVFQGVTGPQQFIPQAFSVKGQAQTLTGELAVELVSLLEGGEIHCWRKG